MPFYKTSKANSASRDHFLDGLISEDEVPVGHDALGSSLEESNFQLVAVDDNRKGMPRFYLVRFSAEDSHRVFYICQAIQSLALPHSTPLCLSYQPDWQEAGMAISSLFFVRCNRESSQLTMPLQRRF